MVTFLNVLFINGMWNGIGNICGNDLEELCWSVEKIGKKYWEKDWGESREFFHYDVICGHSLVGSNACGPPVFQILLPCQIPSQYL
jgi:hypothetical protein